MQLAAFQLDHCKPPQYMCTGLNVLSVLYDIR